MSSGPEKGDIDEVTQSEMAYLGSRRGDRGGDHVVGGGRQAHPEHQARHHREQQDQEEAAAREVDDAAGELAAAIRRAVAGERVVDPGLAAAALSAGENPLTAREREVLQHIARGHLYKEIALRLGISVKTVEAHVSSVLRKLQLSSRPELTRWAAQRRLVD